MPPYRAQGNGLYGSSVYPDTRPRVDIGQAIDAVSGGVNGIIRSVMLRKQTESELATRRQQMDLERQRVGIEQQREARDAANQDRDYQLRQESERHRFLEAGGIPARTDVQAVPSPTTLPASPTPPSPIRGAMGLPGPQLTPSDAPGSGAPVAQPMTATTYTPQSVQTPEGVDPTRSSAYLRGVAVQDLRNQGYATRDEHRQEFQSEQQAARIAAQQRGREYAATAAQGLAQLKARLAASKGPVNRVLTGNARETAMQNTAAGLLEQFGGSVDQASDFLQNDPQGQALAKEGLEPRHLMAARGKYVNTVAGQAVRLQTGANGLTADKATDAVVSTRRKIAPLSTSTGASTGTSTGASTGGTTAGKNTPAPADNFSDDEVAQAMQSGAKTEDDVRSFVLSQRKKLKKATP